MNCLDISCYNVYFLSQAILQQNRDLPWFSLVYIHTFLSEEILGIRNQPEPAELYSLPPEGRRLAYMPKKEQRKKCQELIQLHASVATVGVSDSVSLGRGADPIFFLKS